jgi:hypothetical protein
MAKNPKTAKAKPDPLDAADPLVPKRPKTPPLGEMTEDEKAEILAGRAAKHKIVQEAQDALVAAVEAYDASPSEGQKTVVLDLMEAAEALGITVNKQTFAQKGLLTPVAEPSLDDAPQNPPEPEAPERPEPDLSILHQDASGAEMVPLYNPSPGVMVPCYNGHFYAIRPGGVDLAHIQAANLAVGADNTGGQYSRYGLRRLYLPEPRFAPVAAVEGLTLVEWCRKQNEIIRFIADGVWRAVAPALETDMDKLLEQLR